MDGSVASSDRTSSSHGAATATSSASDAGPPRRPARGASLRFRLLCLSALTIAVALTIAALALVAIFNRHLERRVAQELSVRLVELASGFELDADGRPQVTRLLADPRYDQPYSGAYWQAADAAGPVLRSRSLWDERLAATPPGESRGVAFETDGPNGSTLYVLEREVKFAAVTPPRAFRLSVALDHAELEELGASFLGDEALALSAIGAVLILGAWLQISLGLRPLRRLHEQLALIRQGRSGRLEGRFPDEVAPLAENLNKLVEQQELSVRKARERAGDLAHGLKTPLTILAGEARRLEESGNPGGAESVREQIRHMRAHVDRHLARARSHGASVAGGAATDLPRTCERLLGLMRRMPRAEALDWRNDVPAGLRIRMDPDDFGEVMGNLLDNARLWAASRVHVGACIEGDLVRVHVDDDGPGIHPDRRQQMAERGESGTAPGEGAGLGLSIVTDVLGSYGAALIIADSPLGGCRVTFATTGWSEAPSRGSFARVPPQPDRTRAV